MLTWLLSVRLLTLHLLSDPTEVEVVPGYGLKCLVNGKAVLVGRLKWLRASSSGKQKLHMSAPLAAEVERLKKEALTVVGFAMGGRLQGVVGLADKLRAESVATVAALQQLTGEVWLVTGDNPNTAAAVAAEVGIRPQHTMGGVLPKDKAKMVSLLQKRGLKVIMIGDGVNDSPALAQADVGVAIGGGTDIACEAAAVVLMRDDLRAIIAAVQLSRATMYRVRVNFVWAFLYNIVCIAECLHPPPSCFSFADLWDTHQSHRS